MHRFRNALVLAAASAVLLTASFAAAEALASGQTVARRQIDSANPPQRRLRS